MTAGRGELSLALLDTVRTPPDWPATQRHNQAALAQTQPSLARELEGLGPPPAWVPALGLDDHPTYRVEPVGAPPAWLDGSAAPRRRAAALLREVRPGSGSAAIVGLGCGAEALVLLELLAPNEALFVVETCANRLAAGLALAPLTDALLTRRLWLVCDALNQGLAALLAENPGLLPPTRIIRTAAAREDDVAAVRQMCSAATEQIAKARAGRRAELLETLRAKLQGPTSGAPSLAVIAPTPDIWTHVLVQRLTEAASDIGWSASSSLADRPDRLDLLVHLQAALACDASAVCIIGGAANAWPDTPRVRMWNSADAPQGQGTPLLLRPTPGIIRARERRAAAGTTSRLLLFGDALDTSAAACGIDQPTHVHAWSEMGAWICAGWQRGRALEAGEVLERAGKRLGLRFDDAELAARFEALVRERLIPGLHAQCALEELASAIPLQIFGAGWRESTLPPGAIWTPGACLPSEADWRQAAAALVLRPASGIAWMLIDGASAGVPLAMLPHMGAIPEALGANTPERIQSRADLSAFLHAVRSGDRRLAERAMRRREAVLRGGDLAGGLCDWAASWASLQP